MAAVRPHTAVLAALSVLTALLIQRAALGQLHLPGAAPELVVVVVVAFALLRGPLAGMVIGFGAGLLADMAPPAHHAVGREALVLTLVGYLSGLLHDEAERSALAPMLVVALASGFSVLFDAALGGVFGDSHVTWAAVTSRLPMVVLYDVLVTPFIVPAIGALDRRLDPDSRRR